MRACVVHACSCWDTNRAWPSPPIAQVAERQGGELADAQRQAQALEAELQAKAQEGAALLADSLALKVRRRGPPWWPCLLPTQLQLCP